jgi:FeS assembly protein IscX
MPRLTWNDAEDIGLALYERFPKLDPLSVRFTDLHQWVCETPEFSDDPNASTEGKLEAIQMAWLKEWKDSNE